jgi:hypothetical protein
MEEGAPVEKYKLCPVKHTRDGWYVMKVGWRVVPHYDYNAACKGLSQQGIERELEVNWNATTGKLVYPEFKHDLHVAARPIQWCGEKLYCGWDLAILGTPAFVVTWLNQWGQWCIKSAVAPMEDETVGVYEFGEMVHQHLAEHYALPFGMKVADLPLVHFGDPQGAARPQRGTLKANSRMELKSAFEIIHKGVELPAGTDENGEPAFIKKRGFGWRIQPGAVSNTERQGAVRARLLALTRTGGLASVSVCPTNTVIVEGFNGNYRYAQRADGRYDDSGPEKNWWSHSMNAVEYIATRLFEPEEEEDEDYTPARPRRSRAAGRDY